MTRRIASKDLKYIAAPMVKQSDLPFRILTRRHGATLAYTQMLLPDQLLNDQDYLEHHVRDLSLDNALGNPVVVQLCGNKVETIVQAGRKLQNYCDAIDLNLGCPQDAARDGHYGAYLLGQKDWPLVESIVSGMAKSFTVPVSTKVRLCQPVTKTVEFGQRMEASGSSWVTLHARTVSARRRRQRVADLSEVKRLKEVLEVPVVSNGNVRVWGDIHCNLEYTGADGAMVGETLLGNPCIFSNALPDPVDISLEYLSLCREFPGTAALSVVQTHIRHFIEFQCFRHPWHKKFRAVLGETQSIEEIETLLRTSVEWWRGRQARETACEDLNDVDPAADESVYGDHDDDSWRDDRDGRNPTDYDDYIDISTMLG